jgi:hypothetical protein
VPAEPAPKKATTDVTLQNNACNYQGGEVVNSVPELHHQHKEPHHVGVDDSMVRVELSLNKLTYDKIHEHIMKSCAGRHTRGRGSLHMWCSAPRPCQATAWP